MVDLSKRNLGILHEQLKDVGKMHYPYDDFEKRIFNLADEQLDGKAHWMFMNEPHFQKTFIEDVSYQLRYDHWTNFVSPKDILAAIEKSANDIDADVLKPFTIEDQVGIQATFNMFVQNGFNNTENDPWNILLSKNPDYPYDWILFKDDYPIVQYNSKAKQIDPCLEYSLDKFNSIYDAIMEASRSGDAPGIMCGSELRVSLDGFRQALARFNESDNEGVCGPWKICSKQDQNWWEASFNNVPVVFCFSDLEWNKENKELCDLTLYRKADIPDKVFSEIFDLTRSVFPECKMSSLDSSRIQNQAFSL